MREEYNKNDFVYFVGIPTKNYDPTKEIIAQIDSIEKTDLYWKTKITLIEPYEKCECLIDVLRPIQTKEQHLLNLEFKKKHNDIQFPVYFLGELIITEVSFTIPNKHQLLYLGFFKGDLNVLQNDQNFRQYLNENEEFDFNKFNSKYKNLNNLNDLLKEFIDIKAVNIKKIIYS